MNVPPLQTPTCAVCLLYISHGVVTWCTHCFCHRKMRLQRHGEQHEERDRRFTDVVAVCHFVRRLLSINGSCLHCITMLVHEQLRCAEVNPFQPCRGHGVVADLRTVWSTHTSQTHWTLEENLLGLWITWCETFCDIDISSWACGQEITCTACVCTG